MELPEVVSRDQWREARLALLAEEKKVTHARAAVDAQRRALPMVLVDKDYKLAGTAGPVGLIDLFEGRRQLVIYHFMFDPAWDEGCVSCSAVTDSMGRLEHLHDQNTTLALVSRAPLDKLTPFRERMGWSVPWYSSHGSDFNYDFHVSNDAAVAPVEYNYMDEATLRGLGQDHFVSNEGHGASVFLREGDQVFHTYSSYGRGLEPLLITYHYLDLTPLGRQRHVSEFRHHDRYDEASGHACH